MRKPSLPILIFPLFLAAALYILTGNANDYNRKLIQEDIKKEFSGVVIKKSFERSYSVTLMNKPDILEINPASHDFYNTVNEGDSVIKKANSNKCKIVGKAEVECDCYFLPE